MRKALLFGFVLVCISAISFLTVSPVERKILNPDGTVSASAPAKPAEVEVTNFPAVQQVSGTVSMGNLPAVQSVAGTVLVGNFPLDGNGRLLVAIQNPGSNTLVLHSTTATYQGDLGGRTGATEKCQAEFPGSHFAHQREIASAQETGRGIVWLTDESAASWMDDLNPNQSSCIQWHASNDGGNPTFGLVIGPTGGTPQYPPTIANAADCTVARPLLCA